jgi:hypothetical protein
MHAASEDSPAMERVNVRARNEQIETEDELER